jgi:hypothetical protein
MTAKLISWFQPLRRDDDPSDLSGWSVSQMMDVLDFPAMVGYATSAEAKEWLLRRHVGCYLFRFSSAVGWYALSAGWAQNSVGHWRISTRIVDGAPIFTMNSVDYTSFQDIVQRHSKGGTPISAKKNDGSGGTVDFFLDSGITKREVLADKEDVYM